MKNKSGKEKKQKKQKKQKKEKRAGTRLPKSMSDPKTASQSANKGPELLSGWSYIDATLRDMTVGIDKNPLGDCKNLGGFDYLFDRWSGQWGHFYEKIPDDGFVYLYIGFSDAGNFMAHGPYDTFYGNIVCKKEVMGDAFQRILEYCNAHNAEVIRADKEMNGNGS